MSIKVKFLGVLAGTMLLAGIATVSLWCNSINRLLDEYVRSFTEELMDKTEVSRITHSR